MAIPSDATGAPDTTAPLIDTAAIAKTAQTQAAAQVQQEIAAQTNPLQAEIGTDKTQQTQALQQIGSQFNQLQPAVQGAAKAVGQSYTDAEKVQSQIFAAANANMSQLKQSRAQEAQMLAQQIGGPVAIGEFTAGIDPAASALINLGAGQQLHTLGYAQAGVQAANQFSGQVFPLLRTEAMATARTHFEDQIKQTQAKIDQLRAAAPGAIHTRFNELQAQQLTYQLDQAKYRLDALNAQRNYTEQVKQDQLAQEQADHDWKAKQAQIDAQRNSNELATAGVTGIYRGKPTVAATQASADQKLAAQKLGLDVATYNLNVQSLKDSTKLALRKLKFDESMTTNQYLDAAINPVPGKTVTSTQAVPVPTLAAETGKIKDAYKDPKSPTGYSRLVQIVSTSTTTPITDPDDLVDYLVAHGTAKSIAIARVRSRLGLSDSWTYGKPILPDQLGGRFRSTLPARADQGQLLGPVGGGPTGTQGLAS